MKLGTLLLTLLIFSHFVAAQHDFFILRKGNRNISIFMKDSYMAFQLKTHQWFAGYVKRIQNDSFYLRPLEVIYEPMHIDTLYTDLIGFSINDVYAIPKEGVQIEYINGEFKINMSAGHQHWYWIKSGWIFRVSAAGYAGLVVVNGIIQKDFTFSGSKLGIAAVVFVVGELLKIHYKLTRRLGRKYYLEYMYIR
jgi:hypothetical protein